MFTYNIQKTIDSDILFEGIGLHSGKMCMIRLIPAPPNTGIVFIQIVRGKKVRIPALRSSIIRTQLATTLGKEGAELSTVEHLLSATYALGITNLEIEVQGPEIPILDGSAHDFFEGMMSAGVVWQPMTRPVLKVLKPIKIHKGGAICELLPRSNLRLTVSINFPHPAIGMQTVALDLTPESFRNYFARARTFGFFHELEALQKKNLALGASVENVLAFTQDGIFNPEGMRFPDETVRHKLLDAVGDLALCGAGIEGEFVSYRGGHTSHAELLDILFTRPESFHFEPAIPLSLSKVPHFDHPWHTQI